MDTKRCSHILFPVLFVLMINSLSINVYAQDQAQVSQKEIQEIVGLMEDPEKRAAFLQNLKSLQRLKVSDHAAEVKLAAKPVETKKRRVLFIEYLFVRFETLTGKVMQAAANTSKLLARSPQAYNEVTAFFSNPNNIKQFIKLLANLAAAIAIALITWFLIGKREKKLVVRSRKLVRKIIMFFPRLILKLVPYGMVLISLFFLFRMFPSHPTGHALVLVFFTVLFFYRMVLETFRILLAPDANRKRILPFSDENANYLWVWVNRFAYISAFYFVVTRMLIVAGIDTQIQSFIRGLLLILFPFMINVFILQVARELRTKYEPAQQNGEQNSEEIPKKTIPLFIRYFPVLTIVYVWAIFLFLIVNFEKGFGHLFSATLWTVAVLIGLSLFMRINERLFKRFFTINERVKKKFPGLEAKTNRYLIILNKSMKITLVIISTGIIAQIWGIPVSIFVSSHAGTLIILRAIAILITVGFVIAVMETSQMIKEHLLKNKNQISQKRKTLVPMIITTIKIATGFIAGIVILDRLGINTTPILAGAGIVGLAVGFGSQTLVKDLINGLFILFEESIRVGDYTDLGKNEGMVEAVGLRTIRLRDVSGDYHVVPNSSIETITNKSKEFSKAVIDIGVAYREDADEIMEIMREVGNEVREDPEYGPNILEDIEILGLQRFDDSAIVIRARMKTKPLKQWGLRREFNRRIKRIFDERGIEIPFPHRTIYMGEPKQGPAAPLHLQMEGKT